MPKEFNPQQLRKVVERAQGGSIEDFQRLYESFAKPIFNFIWRLSGSSQEAEDLTQETFVKVHSELPRLCDPAQFKYWLYRIARNEVYQKLRREQRTAMVSIDDEDTGYYEFLEDETPGLNPEQAVLSGELRSVVQRALDAMTPKYRDVFVLAVFHRFSYEDITRIVGRSLLSVKTDIYRARLIVKDHLNEYLQRKS